MIKRTLYLLGFLLLLASCGSYNSIDNFYDAHKNDNQVTAVRVPRFMLTLLSGISPEMQSLIGNTNKEILIYNNNNTTGSFLYFNGNFDPVKVREMARGEDFQKLGDGLINQYNMDTSAEKP